MSARTDLAAAASTVTGVKVTPNYRQSTRPGDGFVRFDQRTADDTGFGYMDTWQVCVIVAQNQADAETWIGNHLDQLIAALEPQGAVISAQPVQLSLEGPTVPALDITVIRAQE